MDHFFKKENFKIIRSTCLLFCLFSLIIKFSNLDHGLPNWSTDDTQHMIPALQLIELDYEKEKGNEIAKKHYEKIWNQVQNYPRGSTHLYLRTIRLFGINKIDVVTGVIIIRGIYVAFLAVALLALLFSKIPDAIKYLSIFLISASFFIHHFSIVPRVHTVTGSIIFISFLFLLRARESKYPAIWLALATIIGAYSISWFFTGAIVFLPILIATIQLRKVLIKSRYPTIFCICLSVSITYFLIKNYLVLESISVDNYDTVSQKNMYQFNYMRVLHVVLGMAPLIGLSYFLGLFFLYKTGSWKKPFWLLVWPHVVLYQLGFLFFVGAYVRHSMLTVYFVTLISSYGLLELYKRYGKRIVYSVCVLAFINIATIFRHQYLSSKETRFMAHEFIYKHFADSQIGLLNEPLGPTLHVKNEKYKNSRLRHANFTQQMVDMIFKTNPNIKNELKKKGIDRNTFLDTDRHPDGPVYFMQMFNFDYFISNQSWAKRDPYIDISQIKKHGKLIAQWRSSEDKQDYEFSHWPNDTVWLLWKLWFIDRPGPTVEIWEMPWSKKKITPHKNFIPYKKED